MIPISNPNIITGSMSPVERELKGFSGTIFRIVSVMVWLIVTFDDCAMLPMFKPRPGWIKIPIPKAIVTANAVVIRYIRIVVPPILPILRTSEMDETPTTNDKDAVDETPTTIDKDVNEIQNPQTGDTTMNTLLILSVFVLAGSGLYVYRRKYRG